MKLDEAIKVECALALDGILALIEAAGGATPVVSIVVSHPGEGASDAIVVGTHSLDELATVAVGMLKNPIREGDVDRNGFRADPGSAIQ